MLVLRFIIVLYKVRLLVGSQGFKHFLGYFIDRWIDVCLTLLVVEVMLLVVEVIMLRASRYFAIRRNTGIFSSVVFNNVRDGSYACNNAITYCMSKKTSPLL